MSADRYRFDIEIATKDAIRNLTVAREGVKDLNESLEDTGSTARKVADILATSATEMEDELARAKKAGEALGKALGPELAAKIGQNRVNEWVSELRRAGLEMDDIEANADQLAASLGRLESVKIDSVANGFTRVEEGADRARGVMSSFVGNAVTELPMIGGAFGPANEAISQFVEGAIQGEIGLKQIAKQAGPMVALAVGVAMVADSFADLAEARKKEREAAEAALEGDFDKTSQLLVERYKMLYDAAEELGVSSEVVTRALLGQQDAVDELRGALTKWAAEAGPTAATTYTQLITQLDHGSKAWEENTKSITENRELTGEVTRQLEDIVGPTVKATKAIEDKTLADRDAADATRDKIAALEEEQAKLDELLGKLDAEDQFQNLILDLMGLQEELADINQAVADGDMSAEEGMRRTALALNDKKRAVILYLTEVLKIPPEIATEIAADVTGAESDIEALILLLQQMQDTAAKEVRIGPIRAPATPAPKSSPAGKSIIATGSSSSATSADRADRADSYSAPGQVIVISPAGADPHRWHNEQRRWLRRNGIAQ